MLKTARSTLLLATLSLTLAACSDEPPPVETVPSPPAPVASDAGNTPKPPPPPPPVEPKTPYELAVRSLTLGAATGVHIESEVAAQGGVTQYATGVAQGRRYSFNVRTLPQGDANFDGSWLVQNGVYMKESTTGFAATTYAPASITLFLDAVGALPVVESALTGERAASDSVAGVACQPRAVNLATQPSLLGKYSALSACVDENAARIVKVVAQTAAGERLSVSLSEQGAPVQMPTAEVFDWSKEFPTAQPGSQVEKKKFEKCPEFVQLTPEGCEGYKSAADPAQ